MSRLDENFRLLESVAEALGELKDEVVFVGGMIAGLLTTDTLVSSVRPTDDIDFIVQVATYSQYQGLLQKLRQRGFSDEMVNDGPICRMKVGSILVDVLPSEGKILGFQNTFFPLALNTNRLFKLPNGTDIRIVTAPLFLCTKLEAFHDRGKRDYLTSSDLEDIISVLNGRPELWREAWESPTEVKTYLRSALASLLQDEEFADALPGLLPLGDQRRGPVVSRRMRAICEYLLPDFFNGYIEVAFNALPYELAIVSSDDCPDSANFPTGKVLDLTDLTDLMLVLKITENFNNLPDDTRRIYRVENADIQQLLHLGLLPPLISY